MIRWRKLLSIAIVAHTLLILLGGGFSARHFEYLAISTPILGLGLIVLTSILCKVIQWCEPVRSRVIGVGVIVSCGLVFVVCHNVNNSFGEMLIATWGVLLVFSLAAANAKEKSFLHTDLAPETGKESEGKKRPSE